MHESAFANDYHDHFHPSLFSAFGNRMARQELFYSTYLTGRARLVSSLPSRQAIGHCCTVCFPRQCRSSTLLGSLALAVQNRCGQTCVCACMCLFRAPPSHGVSRLFLVKSCWNSVTVFLASLAGQGELEQDREGRLFVFVHGVSGKNQFGKGNSRFYVWGKHSRPPVQSSHSPTVNKA
ncbi:hypothetical protein LZ30DRAFT_743112 [Colletotrichum cereale]|nr:hypothetical protein LZ30DRAFT_743112 [Colletotrichum cereale]